MFLTSAYRNQYVGFEATSLDDYTSSAPNPVSFLLALQDLSCIIDDYSKIVTPLLTARRTDSSSAG